VHGRPGRTSARIGRQARAVAYRSARPLAVSLGRNDTARSPGRRGRGRTRARRRAPTRGDHRAVDKSGPALAGGGV